ncbi:hypothetical protein IC229_34730 [Spirosoma sp. BT702]|uniref:DUF4367 domain-containing protein n=1 Tax=Spirosoma profusum TaxID=2771354 RepID=A0A927AWR2_9BACT|nr:hypothetical protein [Spirosoma profusum]MBD2705807.1 hypothetical protein [Spirosoma profusum]
MKQFVCVFLGLAALCWSSPLLVAQPADRPAYLDQRKPMPTGTRFTDLLPINVGQFTRVSVKEPQPGLDGEALYKFGKQELFLLFSLAQDQDEVAQLRRTILSEVQSETLSQAPQSRVGSELGYLRLIGKTIAFYAWNRGLYCFSVDSKAGDQQALDRFMQAFPY